MNHLVDSGFPEEPEGYGCCDVCKYTEILTEAYDYFRERALHVCHDCYVELEETNAKYKIFEP